MINISLTVREAMWILSKIESYDTIYDKIANAFEDALEVNRNKTVTITGGMNLDNRIHCIKSIRHYAGWGLKEAKDWTDVLVGGWKYDTFVAATPGTKNSITLPTPEAAENLLRDLKEKGCEGFLS
jgi:ribosomal protein L7/L12